MRTFRMGVENPDETGGASPADPVGKERSEEKIKVSRDRAKKRLMRDYQVMSDLGDESGISARLYQNNLFHWRALIAGPEESAWEGGLFKLDVIFSDSYPVEPPLVKFSTPIFHPNVYKDGQLCLDTLKSNWTPALGAQSLLISIQSLLTDPNPASAANPEAANQLVENPNEYYETVKRFALESLDQDFSDSDDDA